VVEGVHDTDIEDEIEMFGMIVLFGGRHAEGCKSEAIGAAAKLDVVLSQRICQCGPEVRGCFAVNEESFGCVTDTRSLAFAVEDDVSRCVFVG
jgi:hypothetical protein